jgi:tetratricopeptide (TPR) repeat protein
LRAKPDYENGHISLGLAYSGLKQQDKAIQSFEEEGRVHPENVYPDVYLGDVYAQMKVYPQALLHYQKALQHPDLADTEVIRKAISSIEAAQKQGREEGSDGKD